MALRDSMRDSAAAYLQPGETVQAVLGAQTASQYLAALTGVFLEQHGCLLTASWWRAQAALAPAAAAAHAPLAPQAASALPAT